MIKQTFHNKVENKQVKHIISQLKLGDKSGFNELIKAYQNMVYGLSLKMTGSIEDAEEITQDTFVKVYQRIYSFRGESKFSTWVYQIAYFTAINYLKRVRKNSTNEIPETFEDKQNNSLEELGIEDQKRFIDLALGHLTPQERALITLFYLDEFSLKEVAQIVGLSTSNTKVKLFRTRSKMKTTLQQLLAQELQSLY